MFLSQSSSLPEGWRCGAEVSAGVKVSVDAFGLSLIPELLLKCASQCVGRLHHQCYAKGRGRASFDNTCKHLRHRRESAHKPDMACTGIVTWGASLAGDRKSTRLNSSHSSISYAVFCLKKKKKKKYNKNESKV